ncbi:tudor domain-containing protein 7-like [Fopius arisanus]|uniref:Tdrd7_0 protein n=1 Tax=Fopius arisanus TaxID=64838 RepID=A0A0C9RRB8_9HYME|nr:PREDICTED: tudor domain-containing protein 7-like [Fopius arisanus]XP_011303924.1 PREDICTED: tudor domain-containing protein 7-like [Fopius arisanus]
MDEVASTLRACLITSKGGVRLDHVNRDYYSLEGENIPYRRLGFQTLESFISKVPRLRQYQRGGITFVEVIPDSNTAHLAELIKKQRTSRKKRKPLRVPTSWRRPVLPNVPRDTTRSTRCPPTPQSLPKKPQGSQACPKSRSNAQKSSNGAVDPRNLSRQTSLPQLVSAPRNSRAPPPLKLARPLSERLRRSPERKVIISSHSKPLTPPHESDPRDELRLLMKRLNLSAPEYKNFETKSKGGKISFFSGVQVGGNHKYNSFPLEASSTDEAEKLSATAALNALNKLYGPPAKMRETTDRDVILQRIVDIVDVHPSGVFMEKLPLFYKEKHEELLPSDWMDVVEGSGELSLEKVVENAIIICRSKEENPVNSVSTSNQGLASLILPEDNLWPVYVSHVESTNDIWIRLLEDKNNEEFFKMCQELSSRMINSSPCQVEIHGCYVTKVEDEWQRVRVKALEDSEAKCFFLDTGEEDVLDVSELLSLPTEFFKVPAQAIRVSLFRSNEEITVCDTTAGIARELLVDKTFYLQALSREEDNVSHVITGIFYDTSSETDDDMNERITKEILRVMELSQLEVQLASRGRVLDVFISHIEYNGDVYLQIRNDGLDILCGMMNSLTESLKDEERVRKARHSGAVDSDEIYLAQKSDGSWVRVQVAFPGIKNSRMRLVDFGELMDVERSKLLKLWDLSEAVARFPVQAVQVELNNVKRAIFTEEMAVRLRKLALPGEHLVCKVVQMKENTRPAVVELFKRVEPDNLLVSINHTLVLEPELTKTGDGNNNVKTRKRIERTVFKASVGETSMKILKLPTIPEIESCFDVHVTQSAANPDNFVVQPLEDKEKLEAMMKSMQIAYSGVREKLRMEEIKEGKVYAVKLQDGIWYRATVNKILGEQVAVYLSDFGNINVIGLGQLQLLKKEFMELPCQAIKAGLNGIQPANGDWSLAACIRFKELVVNKDFVSIVKRIDQDETAPGFSLGLDLIDVSIQDVDVLIHEILLKEKWATTK